MTEIILVGLAGFLAAGVDGALGMGYGPTSSTILLSSGVSPAATAAIVNLAKVATGLVGAAAHWRFGNVDRRLAVNLAVPGVVGAAIGSTLLSMIDGDTIRPWLAVLLMGVGVRMFIRFARRPPDASGADGGYGVSSSATRVAGVAGGVTNGLVGAWGPVVTPILLHAGVPPRIAVGSVNAAEVAVALTAVGTLAATIGRTGFDLATAMAMLVGGVVAAPLAASVVRHLPARPLGLMVSVLLVASQAHQVIVADLVPVDPWLVSTGLVVVLSWAGGWPWITRRLADR